MRIRFLVALTTLGLVFITSCKKNKEESETTSTPPDVTAPMLSLTGANPLIVDLNQGSDPGGTAIDAVDGVITVTSDWSKSVKINEVKSYIVNYKASDKAGNLSTTTRTVKVKSDLLAGGYDCTDVRAGSANPAYNGTFNYTVTVTQSPDEFGQIRLLNFGGFGSSVQVLANVAGNSITIPTQTKIISGGGPITFSGSGTYNGAEKKITTINYTTDGFGNGAITLNKQ